MEPEMVFDPTCMPAACEVCLRSDCGEKGYVHLPGTPIQIGRGCVERMYATIPKVAVVTAFSGVCPDCSRTFTRAASLGSHRRVHKLEVAA